MDDQEPSVFDFRGLLSDELKSRQSRNSGYSLRAFARDLEVAPGFLSGMMNGDKLPTEERAMRMASLLNWGSKRGKMFSTMVRYARTKGEAARLEIRREIEKFSSVSTPEWRMSLDKFKIVSDWYHFAIVEYLDLDGVTGTVEDISRRLGVGASLVRQALHRLESVRLIRRNGDRAVKEHANYIIEDIPSAAIREHHLQILDRAKQALVSQTTAEREFSSTMLAIAPELLPELKESIRKFRSEVEELANRSPKKSAIYMLAIQAFRIDR